MALAIEPCGRCEREVENATLCPDGIPQRDHCVQSPRNLSTTSSDTHHLSSINVVKPENIQAGQVQRRSLTSSLEVPVHAFTPGLVYDARSQVRESLSESQSLLATQRYSRECKTGYCNSTHIDMKELRPKSVSGRCPTGAQCKGSLQKKGSPFSHISPTRKISSNSNLAKCCRICYEGTSKEALISPCKCSGTMGNLHRSCVEKWLGSSGTNRCEICDFEYITVRERRPFRDWFFQPHCTSDRRNLIGDFFCFLLLSPLAVVSTWLCASGAFDYAIVKDGLWEASGLFLLAVFLVVIYVLWCVVAVRHHRKIFDEWREQNERVRVIGAELDEKDERPSAVVHTPHFVTHAL